MDERIGLRGLGALGAPMAANLLDAGYALTVYNRTAGKAEPLAQKGAQVAASPLEAVTPGGIVVSVLCDADAVENVVTGENVLERLGPGGVHVCMCTGSPETAKRLAKLHAEHGSSYVEALVFGRPEAASARKPWMPIAGPQAAKKRVRPLLTAMGAQGIFDFGEEVGTAVMVKIVGNFLLITAARSMVEGLGIVEKTGGDVRAVVDMLTRSLFPSPIYQSYGTMIAEKSLVLSKPDIPLKDLGLFQAFAHGSGVPTPIAQTIVELVSNGQRE